MKKRIANWLGLATTQEIDDLKLLGFELDTLHSTAVEEMRGLREDFRSFKKDMSALYGEVSSDIKRVDKKIMAVKPILKVEDKEAVDFIKGILSKHDNKMNNQENQLADSHRALIEMQDTTRKAVDTASEATAKINNVLIGLGLKLEEHDAYSVENIKKLVINASLDGMVKGA